MNAPSQILICNPEIEWVKRTAFCLLSAFARLFAPSLLVQVCAFDRQKNAY